MRIDSIGKIISLLFVVLFLGLACTLPGGEEPVLPTSEPAFLLEVPEAVEEAEVPYLATVPARDVSKIILMGVEPDSEGNLSKVVLMLPENLVGSNILANDVPVEGAAEGPGAVYIELEGKVAAKTVVFQFTKGGEPLASCTINMEEQLSPTGDCEW